jgi:hypothetical protein
MPLRVVASSCRIHLEKISTLTSNLPRPDKCAKKKKERDIDISCCWQNLQEWIAIAASIVV